MLLIKYIREICFSAIEGHNNMTRMKFMNIEIDNLTMQEAIKKIDELIKKDNCSYVVTPNVDHIVQVENDLELKEVYKNASLILTDGKPLIWISQYYKSPIKEKISGSDLFPKICQLAQKKKYTLYFLGAGPGIAKRAADNLIKKYPGLQIVKTYSPSYGFEKKPEEVNKIIEDINKYNPDILIVGLGCPKQEKFIYKYHRELNVPLSLGLGASLDFEAGNIKRAPKWVSNIGFEWLYRIFQDPKRLAKRYLIDDIKIAKLIRKYKQVR